MNKGNDTEPTGWKEARRLRAWELVQKGWKQTDVAEALGVTRGAVSQWVSRARRGGVEALSRRKPPGGQSKLNGAQLARLPGLLAGGPPLSGFAGRFGPGGGWPRLLRENSGSHTTPPRWDGF